MKGDARVEIALLKICFIEEIPPKIHFKKLCIFRTSVPQNRKRGVESIQPKSMVQIL
jgi:hypothetical protein